MEGGHPGLIVRGNGASRRAHKPAPMSAAAVYGSVKSVPPSGRNKKRPTASATTQRETIMPPVCGVQPGKVLELRTRIGLTRAKSLLEQQQQQPHTEAIERTANTRGHLKSARLQPLGVISNPVITPNDCLGVVPVTPRRKGDTKQRPRSSTAPGVHFDLPDDGGGRERVGIKVKVKRRSYSAAAARSVNSNQLEQLLSISTHLGLVPKKDEITPAKPPEISTTNSSETESTRKFPSVVVRHAELGIKVEVKGLKKASEPQDCPALGLPKLPPITDSSPQKSPSNSSMEEHPPSIQPVSEASPSQDITEGSPRRISIVSLGEAEVDDKSRNKGYKRKRHLSSGSQSARLSLGWSPPQPIEPLKGSSLPVPTIDSKSSGKRLQARTNEYTPSHQEGGEGSYQLTHGEPERVMSPNMLSVNVSEVLVLAEKDDNDT